MIKKNFRSKMHKLIALLLSFVMAFSAIPVYAAQTDSKSGSGKVSDKELKKALKADSELYPDGGFEFFISQLEAKEGSKKLELVVVRRGGTKQKASVDFKAVSVTAAYGEDYTLSVKESMFSKKILKSDNGSKTLADSYDLTKGLPIVNEGGKDEVKTDSEESEQGKAITASSEKSGLQAAKDTFLNKESSQLNWTEIDKAEQEEAEAVSGQGSKALEEFAKNAEGTSCTLNFKKGEFKKTIEIDIIDDSVSETDEQVMFLLSNAQDGVLAGTTTSYLNIKDNDEGEKVVFALDTDKIEVNRSKGIAQVKINRISGVEKMASVIIGTGAEDAQPDVDYKSFKKEVIFAQGITEQTVEVEILDNPDATGDVTLKVALDAESSFVQEGKAEAVIIIKDDTIKREKTNKSSTKAEDKSEEDSLDPMAAEAWSQTFAVSGTASISGKANAWSGRQVFLQNIDLSTADYIDVTWRSNEGSTTTSYTYKDGCDTKTGYNYYYDRDTYVYINDIMASLNQNSNFSEKTTRINLTDAMKTTTARLALEVYTKNNNNNATARLSKVVVHYPGYQFTITNTPYTDGVNSNQYTEKIYTESGSKTDSNNHRYNEGTKFTIATAQFSKNGSATYQDSITLHKSTDNITVKHNYNTNKNSNGVSITYDFAGNTYLVGYQLMIPGSSSWSPVIRPNDLVFSKSFITTYGKYAHAGNEFRVRAVYRPYAANLMFQNLDTSKGSYNNAFATNEVFRCTQLDTIEVKGMAASGYAVDGFSLGAHADGWLHKSSNTLNYLADMGDSYHNQSVSTINSETQRVSASEYAKVAVGNAKTSSVIPNVITFTPDKEFTYINMVYSTPKITLKVDPLNNEKDKGAVVYSSSDSEDTVMEGDYENPLVIPGVMLNKEYNFVAVPVENYKAYWKDFTGDENGDGMISAPEQKLVEKYSFVRTASTGNAYTFRPILPNSLIYYGFKLAEENRYAGFIDGIVGLKTKPIFGDQEKVVAVNGAQISVAGMTTTTKSDDKFGGMDENGGDGYFSISDRSFVSGDNVTLNISYGDLSLTATQAVNAAGIYTIDSYDTIRVIAASAYNVSGSTATSILPASISNADKTFRMSISTASTNDAVSARKAVYRFYRKDGSLIQGADKTVQSVNGIFVLDFNPATLKIPAGAGMTVQFYDQNDKAYYEHDMGFSFAQSLGFLSFLSSFNFGGAEKAIEMVGVIDSAFSFGWDGDMEEKSDIVSVAEDGNTKTISLGFSFNYEHESEDGDDAANKKDAVESAAKGAGTSEAQKAAQNSAADGAIDKNGANNKSDVEIGASGEISCSFALGITICKSETPEHKGEWYFKDMMLCVKAAGGITVNASYMTPIGIPVLISFSAGASGSATFIIEQNYDKKEYYFSNVLDTQASKINLFDFNMKNADRAFDAYGIFNISPYIDIRGGLGFSFLNIMIGGRADFSFDFYTSTTQKDSGNVTLSAYVNLKFLFFTTQFDIASKNYNLFGDAKGVNAFTDEDYRYESLGRMTVDDRAHLKSRTKWNGSAGFNAQSVADTSGIEEFVMRNGVNPNPDIKLQDLGNGKYLAVFIDDDPARAAYNSTAVYYTVYSGTAWSEPKLIENDGTADDAPNVFDLGDRGIYVAWSSADKVFTSEVSVIESLMSMNIHGVFFDKTKLQFGSIEEITKTNPYSYKEGEITICDETADVDPHISYDNDTNRMLIFYTKSEYTSSSTDEEGMIGDAVNPYSVIAYRVYDFTTGKWETEYTSEEQISPDYQKAWYGQRFLDLAPLATIEESLDELGYWKEKPIITPYQNHTYTGGDGLEVEQDPVVMETDAITYNGLTLFTYVLDYDGNRETETDRDIFLQIYNFNENSFSHPIMVTSDNKAESNIKLAHGCYSTILAYLADGTLKAFNISKSVRERLIKTTVNGQELYYIDRSAPEKNESETGTAYEPVMTIAGQEAEFTSGTTEIFDASTEEMVETDEKDAAEENNKITGFELAATNDYIYAMWTQRKTTVKKGIDETSEEAADAANRLSETQIYAARFDCAKGVATKGVQVTDEPGVNYGSLTFIVKEGNIGAVKALATKAGTKIITEGKAGEEVSYPVEDSDNRALVNLDFTPVSTLKMTDISIDELTAGTDSPVSIDFYNDGLETLTDLTFTVEEEDGKEIYKEEIKEGKDIEYVLGGASLHFGFPITLHEDATGTKFTYTITDKNNKELVKDTYEEEIPLEVDVTQFEARLTDRNTVKFSVSVRNNSRRKSGPQNVSINKTKGNSQLSTIDVPSLLPGESAYFEKENRFAKYSDLFTTYVTEDEAYEAVTEFIAATGCGAEAKTDITLRESKEQRLRMSSIQKLEVVNSKNFMLLVGEVSQLNTTIETIAYAGSRYEGMEDADYNTNNANGIRVMYKTDDTSLIRLYDSGYIEALKPGTATITAYVMPDNNKISYSSEDGSIAEDNFTTLPDEAIKKIEVKVTITTDKVEATGITLNKNSLSLARGKTSTLTATVLPENATNRAIVWDSSVPSVATVTNGIINAKKAGVTMITATTENGKTASCKVTVTSVKFAKNSLSIGLKESYKLKPTLSKYTTDKLSKVSYKSSSRKTVTVKKNKDGSAKITGKKKGTAKITVTSASGASAKITIKVKNAPKKITPVKKTITVKKGKYKKIGYKLTKKSASAGVTFKSKNSKVAVISGAGKVKGIKKGTAKITITTFNKKSATVIVKVK